MQILKRGLMAAGALALAAMLLNYVAPKSVHAAVAALVQVENTSANPVPTQVVNTSASPVPNKDVDAPARNALVLTCYGLDSCATATIPAGYTFILDSLSVATNGPMILNLLFQTNGTHYRSYVPLAPIAGTGEDAVLTNLTIYADAGSNIGLSDGTAGLDIAAIFSGHLVSTP